MLLQSKLASAWVICLIFFAHKSMGQPNDSAETMEPIIGYGDALILGLVEGVTEFLPISSTGHLILTNEWLLEASSMNQVQLDAVNAYSIVIQAGAIVAVALIYARRIIALVLGILGFDPVGRRLAINLIAAFVPAALLGPLLDEKIEAVLFGATPVAVALILGAIFMSWAERRKKNVERIDGDRGKDLEDLSLKDSFIVGLLQCVAMCPGTSRSMMTIVGGYFVGLSRRHAAEFSFLLGLVTLTAAAGYKVLTRGRALVENLDFGPMVFGCLVAGIAAGFSVRWLVGYLASQGLGLFVWYRLILGLLLLLQIYLF